MIIQIKMNNKYFKKAYNLFVIKSYIGATTFRQTERTH